jgi:hypothetical protein
MVDVLQARREKDAIRVGIVSDAVDVGIGGYSCNSDNAVLRLVFGIGEIDLA